MSAPGSAVLSCLFGAVALCITATPASARMSSPAAVLKQGSSGQIAATGFPDGSSKFRSLTAQWWQWVLSIPVPVNPLLDENGEDCMVGQRGAVWFLVGNFGGGTTTRQCSVPEGKRLFFPVVNNVNIDTPNVCGSGPERVPVAELRALSATFVNGAVGLQVRLDGKPIRDIVRVKSEVFEVALPETNLFDAPCAGAGGVPAGIYAPAVDDGYYVQLKPLKAGKHKLEFRARVPSQNFVLDVTYHLTVVPVKRR